MKQPLFVRALTSAEHAALQAGLRSRDAFTHRRCQILLASAKGQRPSASAAALGCTAQAVRNAIHAFHAEKLACLKAKPPVPTKPRAAWPRQRDEDLKALLHQRPRCFDRPTSLWTLQAVAEVCHAKGWTERLLSDEAIRLALRRLGVRWRRAKHWVTSPDPEYARKKSCATG